MNEKNMDRIRDFVANHKKAIAVALCALLILPTLVYFVYMELSYGRMVIVTKGGVAVDRVLYRAPGEFGGTRAFERSINVAKGEYIVDVLLDDGSMYITMVEARSFIRPTRIRPRALALEPELLSGRMYENVLPLRDGIYMGYASGMLPHIHFPQDFRALNMGVQRVSRACRASDEYLILLGHRARDRVDYTVAVYGMASDTYRVVQVSSEGLMSGSVDAFCGSNVMYIVDKSGVYEVGLEGVVEVGLRDHETIASANGNLVISMGAKHLAVLYGSDFIDPFSIVREYDNRMSFPVDTDDPLIGDIEWPEDGGWDDFFPDGVEEDFDGHVEEARIVVSRRDGGGVDAVIELGERNDVFAISLSPGGDYLAVLGGGFVTIYDVMSGAELYTLPVITVTRDDLVWYDDERFFLLTGGAVIVSNASTRETFSIMARTRERAIHRLSAVHDGYLYFTVNQRRGILHVFSAYRVRVEDI